MHHCFHGHISTKIYALVIARFRVQYDQYFPSFSYFTRNEENIGHIVRDKRAITSLSLT